MRLPRSKAEWDQQAARERVTGWVEGRRRQFEQVREALRQSSTEADETPAPSQSKPDMSTALWLLSGSRQDGFDRQARVMAILGLDRSEPDHEAALVQAVRLYEGSHWLAALVVGMHAEIIGVSVETVLGMLEEAVCTPPPNAAPPRR